MAQSDWLRPVRALGQWMLLLLPKYRFVHSPVSSMKSMYSYVVVIKMLTSASPHPHPQTTYKFIIITAAIVYCILFPRTMWKFFFGPQINLNTIHKFSFSIMRGTATAMERLAALPSFLPLRLWRNLYKIGFSHFYCFLFCCLRWARLSCCCWGCFLQSFMTFVEMI